MKSLVRLRASIVVVKVPAFLLLLFSLAQAQQPQWKRAIGTEGHIIGGIDVFRTHPDTLYANSHLGLLISTDQGEHWDSIGTFIGPGGPLKVDPLDSKIIYAWFGVPLGSAMLATSDRGETWRDVSDTRDVGGGIIEIDPVDRATIYVSQGAHYIRRSTDHGRTWPYLPRPPQAFVITALAIAPSNNKILYAAYWTGVFKSTDRGDSWTYVWPSTQALSMLLAVDPLNPDVVYAAIYERGMYKSTNGGTSWNEINNGLTSDNRDIYSLVINPRNRLEVLIGIGDGQPYDTLSNLLFRTTNGGDSWYNVSMGFPSSGSVSALAIDSHSLRWYAGVNSVVDSLNFSGVYILGGITGLRRDDEKIPQTFTLSQNYPNPFNGQTTIEFNLPRVMPVELKVYSTLGQEISTILKDSFDAGSHRLHFDAGNLPSGAYIYRLATPVYTQSKWMIILR